jgi:nucleoside-diphosphate-sugar epimerase
MSSGDSRKTIDAILDVERLEELLSEPTPAATESLAGLEGDLILLGAGGKMGATLARMARRASDAAGTNRRIIGVSRFTSAAAENSLRRHGIDTVRCDLTQPDEIRRLPDAANVIFMVGVKFGTSGDPAATWAANTFVPGAICHRYRDSRISAFSSGNIYGLASTEGHGSREEDPLRPVGEYAMTCLGRERVFDYFSRKWAIPLTILRLNYACELRYGILVDLAKKIWRGEPVDLSMGYFNVIWQADANAMALSALARAATPPWVVNVTGPEKLSVRDVCQRLGRRMGRPVHLTGVEGATALLSDAKRGHSLLGPPRIGAEQLTDWIADWVIRGGETFDKPTHFESRDGAF